MEGRIAYTEAVKVLVLGGTRFVGRHLTEHLLRSGDEVTLFHRTPTDLFPECEHLYGDRDGGLAPLENREWDAVIDVSGYVPRLVRDAVRTVRAGRYVFVSTISVYAEGSAAPDETSPVAPLVDDTEEVNASTYAGLKVACEREVTNGDLPWAIVRPTVVVGPHDPSDRLGFWVRRRRRGTPYPVPARLDQPVQVVHAGDVAWAIREAIGIGGTYNLAGDPFPFSALVGPQAVPVADWEGEARPFVDWPLVMPTDGSEDYFFRASNLDAKTVLGWTPRSIEAIVEEAYGWVPEAPPANRKYGLLSPETEAAWLSRAR